MSLLHDSHFWVEIHGNSVIMINYVCFSWFGQFSSTSNIRNRCFLQFIQAAANCFRGGRNGQTSWGFETQKMDVGEQSSRQTNTSGETESTWATRDRGHESNRRGVDSGIYALGSDQLWWSARSYELHGKIMFHQQTWSSFTQPYFDVL